MCRFRVRGAGYGVNEEHVACRVRAKNPDETCCLTGGIENFLNGAVTEQKEGRKRAFFFEARAPLVCAASVIFGALGLPNSTVFAPCSHNIWEIAGLNYYGKLRSPNFLFRTSGRKAGARLVRQKRCVKNSLFG